MTTATTTTAGDHITAVRTWNGDKATIIVTLPAGWAHKRSNTWQMKGKRAAAAEVVVIGVFNDVSHVDILGCRSDRAAALKETQRLASMTSWQHKGYTMPATPYMFAEVIEIIDAA